MSTFKAPEWAALPLNPATLKTNQRSIDIGAKPYYLFGRDPSHAPDILIDDPSVSRRHLALVHHANGKIYIIDLASREGSAINGTRIQPNKPTRVDHGDSIQLGNAPPYQVYTDPSNATDSASTQAVATEMRASHLLVKHRESRRPSSRKEPVVTRSPEEALAMIVAFREQIVSGSVSFADLAKAESHCSSAERGGDLGVFKRGAMQKAFEDATLALDIGELSPPVYSDSGIHLILRTG